MGTLFDISGHKTGYQKKNMIYIFSGIFSIKVGAEGVNLL